MYYARTSAELREGARHVIAKRIEDITADDIGSLVENQVPEDRTLDYKRQLPEATDRGHKDFAKDVAAFANAAGGDLIYGIDETRGDDGQPTGLPAALEGLVALNLDSEERRLTQIILNGVSPRVHGVRFRSVPLPNDRYALVIRVPKSYHGPHMVTLQGDSRFPTRDTKGGHPMDWHEIRDAFAAGSDLAQRIAEWRNSRIDGILRGESPVLLSAGPKAILHVVPWASFGSVPHPDVLPLLARNRLHAFRQYNPDTNVTGAAYCLDGLHSHFRMADHNEWLAYALAFREGMVEYVTTSGLEGGVYASDPFEIQVMRAAQEAVRIAASANLPAPYTIFLTLTSATGLHLPNLDFGRTLGVPLPKDVVMAPGVVVEEYDPGGNGSEVMITMRSTFDYIWNGLGLPRDDHFGDDGTWRQI
jgi:hypothetical protein